MPNSFCLPPVEYCRGTTPTQAAKSRPRRKAAPLPMAATVAVETSGPKPGIWRSRRQRASSLLMRSISSVIALMSISVCFHSCHNRSSSQRRRGLRFCSASSITVGRLLAQVDGPRREGEAAFQQESADLVDQRRATLHQSIAHTVHGLPIELLLRFDLQAKRMVLVGHEGFGDRCPDIDRSRSCSALAIGFDELRRE